MGIASGELRSSNFDPENIACWLSILDRELAIAPQDPLLHRAMSEAKGVQGDELGALAHLATAEILEGYADGSRAGPPIDLCNIATGFFMKGDPKAAMLWYQLVLLIDPDMAIAHLNLTAIYSGAGRIAEAEASRENAYKRQRVFIESAADPVRRVLVLLLGRGPGNVPIDVLLPVKTNCRIKYIIDYAAEDEDAKLPPFDLVFNAIGEPDRAAPLADRLGRFALRCNRPLLNPPDQVARTQRHHMGALLADLENVLVAPCIAMASPPPNRAALTELLAGAGIGFPLLVRPEASHGGIGLVRADCIEALEPSLYVASGAHYLTEFYDYRSPDGYYRKYRIIFVDRVAFPYHLAISTNWMVHYYTANMEESSWKMEEEQHFLQEPSATLGERAMAAIAEIGRRLDLDYCGIDIALLPDGRVLVFEANATMLVHAEPMNGKLGHKNHYVRRIADAFEQLLASRCHGVELLGKAVI